MLVVNTFIFSIFQEETFGVSLVLIPSQILLYNQIFLLSDGRSLALLHIKTPWLRRLSTRTNCILCTKIRFPPIALSSYKDYHPFTFFRYQYHWWELSNEVLHETFHQWAPEIPKVKLLHFWIYLIKGHFLGTFDFDLW